MDWKWLFFSFEGRINRAKWWLTLLVFVVLSIVIWFVLLPLVGVSVWATQSTGMASVASLIVFLIFLYPATAVMVKRLNDRNRPAWMAAVFWAPSVLSILGQMTGVTASMQQVGGQAVMMPTGIGWVINILSLVIGIWALVELGCLGGTRGANQHGPDPLGA
jgi:uncharacterized membrane protein YhaH (DUF805 family)